MIVKCACFPAQTPVNGIYLIHALSVVLSYMYLIKTKIIIMHLGSKDFPQAFKNFVAIENIVTFPLINPLIYGFKLTKIRNKIMFVLTSKT